MNKARLSTAILTVSVFLSGLISSVVYASSWIKQKWAPPSPVDPGTFGTIVGKAYNLLYPIAIIYGILQIVFSGYLIMMSEGEPKALSSAKEHLTSSIIGIIFVILAVVILKIIISTFLVPV